LEKHKIRNVKSITR